MYISNRQDRIITLHYKISYFFVNGDNASKRHFWNKKTLVYICFFKTSLIELNEDLRRPFRGSSSRIGRCGASVRRRRRRTSRRWRRSSERRRRRRRRCGAAMAPPVRPRARTKSRRRRRRRPTAATTRRRRRPRSATPHRCWWSPSAPFRKTVSEMPLRNPLRRPLRIP